jgi:hypothetical protein
MQTYGESGFESSERLEFGTHTFTFLKERSVSVCLGCHNRVSQTGYLPQQKFMVSQFWRQWVKIKVLARTAPSEACGETCSTPLSQLLVVC